MRSYLLFWLVWAAGWSVSAQNQVYFVHQQATGNQSGQSWQNAFTDLHAALDAAQSGDQVWIATGTYLPDADDNRDRSFVLKSGLRLYGGFAGNESALIQRDIAAHPVILSGDIGVPGDSLDNAYTILYMPYPDSTTLVDGFVFQHGYAYNDTIAASDAPAACGAAVYIMAKSGKAYPTFENCKFLNNAARLNGGAVYVNGQSSQGNLPVFKNCDFENNKARLGGAIYLYGGSDLDRGKEIENCRFILNRASFSGGSIYYYNTIGNSDLSIFDSYFFKNTCFSEGVVFYIFKFTDSPCRLEFNHCTLDSNGYDGISLIYGNLMNEGIKINFKFIGNIVSNTKLVPAFAGGASHMLKLENGSNTSTSDSFNISSNRILNNTYSYAFLSSVNYEKYIVCNNNFCYRSPAFSVAAKTLFYENNVNLLYDHSFLASFFLSNSLINIKNNIFYAPLNGIALTLNNYSGSALDTVEMFINNNLFANSQISVSRNASENACYENFINNVFYNSGLEYVLNTISPNLSLFFDHNLSYRPCSDMIIPGLVCGPNNIVSSDPGFVNPGLLDFRLLPCSPLIDAGSNAAVLGLLSDLDGALRIQGGTVDIGPYEAAAFGWLAQTASVLPACEGSLGGAIQLHPENGCEPLLYHWEPNVGNGAEINNLPPGDYAVTVSDQRGHSISDTITIAPAPAPTVLEIETTALNCGSVAGGTALVGGSGGTAPYTYQWSNDSTGVQAPQLAPAPHSVTLTDALGCLDSLQLNIAANGQLTLSVDGGPISCHGDLDGFVSAAAANGLAPFHYAWVPVLGPDSSYHDLSPGQYVVTVTDAYGCTSSFSFQLNDPPLLSGQVLSSPASGAQSPDGTATAVPTGGTLPYNYAWSIGAVGMEQTGLMPGWYTVTVTDGHGCTSTASGEVSFISGTEDMEAVTLKVWPNPAATMLNFELPGSGRVELYDPLGRRCLESALKNGRAALDVRALPAGVYRWRWQTRSGWVVVER